MLCRPIHPQHCRLRQRYRHGGLTLGSRVQTFDRCAPVGYRPALSQRPAEPHATAQADRVAGVCLRCVVVGGLCPRRDLPDALGRAALAAYSLTPWIGLAVAAVMLVVVASYRQNVHAYPSGGGDYEVVTTNLGDTAGLVGGQRADGGLRSHRCGFDGVGDVEHRLGAFPSWPKTRCGSAWPPILLVMALEPARDPRVRGGLRDPDLRVHRRDRHHDRLGIVPDLCVGQSAAGRIRRFPDARRARRHRRVRAWCSWWPGRSPRAAPR